MCAAEKKGRFLIAVIFGAKSTDQRFIQARKLFDTAFSEKLVHQTLVSNEKRFSKAITGAAQDLFAQLKEEISIDFFPSEEKEGLKAYIQWDQDLSLPISKGDKVGEVQIISKDQQLLKKGFVYASKDVSMTISYKIKNFFSKLF